MANLWSRQEPEILIALKADLETVRLRRNNPRWRATVWSEQQVRLADAYDHADLVVETSNRSVDDLVAHVLEYLTERGLDQNDSR